MERNWPRIVQSAALIAAATLTLFLLMGLQFVDVESLAGQVAAMAGELALLTLVARSHARLLASASLEPIS